jgi:S-DNA-T family DNA segregation ATPase FtsK/SpoIIIE
VKVKLTLRRSDEANIDLVVVAEATSTVGDLARSIANSDPRRGTQALLEPGAVTLRFHASPTTDASIALDPALTLDEASIGSGTTISIGPLGAPGARAVAAAGIMRVLEGPDAGRSYELPIGHSTVGRDPSGRVPLTDPLASKLHLRVNVSDHVEIIDAGSSNGTLVNGEPVDRAVLMDTDRVTIGDTVAQFVAAAHGAAIERAGVVQFNRSPRLDPIFPGMKLKAPEPPERPQPGRLPWLALIAPLIVGAMLIFVSPGNVLSLVFIALSPVLMVASFVDNLLQNRKAWKTARKEFFDSVEGVRSTIRAVHEAEIAGRLSETPSSGSVLLDTLNLGQLLWTRRPEHDAFLSLRLGLGRMPSRIELEMPGQRKGPRELWDALESLQDEARWVDAVPVAENFRVSGSLGFAGPLDPARAVARGVVAQLVGLHSPAEVIVGAIASSGSSVPWEWLKWLPHVGSPFSPVRGSLASTGPLANALVSELEDLVEQRSALEAGSGAATLPAFVLIVEDDNPADRARLIGLAETGPAVGVHLLWVAPALTRIPAACRTFVDLDAADGSTAGSVHTGHGVQPVTCEPLDLEEASAFAREMAPIVDAGARVDDASDLPRNVSFLQVAGTDLASESAAVVDRWLQTNSILTGPSAPGERGTKIKPNLRAVFGQGATEPFALDLRADGPHALVGGTTGSGKSEFLQSWVLGLASAHSPQRVAFLFVDYKGGAAFAEFKDLPHNVGIFTDLRPHLVRRALTSLRAEIRRREQLFGLKRHKDIIDFETSGDPDVPPSLVIVVDEFAALAQEIPEFVDGMVDIAQRGRALGLHLILATQRPAGVIGDNLRANTNLRIALRMADESDSSDVLGSPMAAGFDPAIQGRGAAKTGPGRIRSFQTGYAGGTTTDEPEPVTVEIVELRFGSGAAWEVPIDPAMEAKKTDSPKRPKDIARIVTTIGRAARAAHLPAPSKPWLPVLAPVYDYSKLSHRRTDEELILGVLDDPESQAHPIAAYLPDRDANLAIVGTGGSGKSTALRAVAVAAAVTPRGGPVQVYGLDYAGGGLQMLDVLPHVGAIIAGDDEDRMARLLLWLRDVVDERQDRYKAANAATIVEYRAIAKRPDEARILLLIDGMGAFKEAYESSIQVPWFSVLSQLATYGREVGVHLVLAGDRPAAIPPSLSSSIQRRLVLRLANADDYGNLGVDSDVLSMASPPGRGILGDLEVQIAVLGGDPNMAVQKHGLEELADAMRFAGVPPAPTIDALPEVVRLVDLPKLSGDDPTIGLADDTLGPIGAQLEGAFVIGGPPASGKSTTLVTLASALARTRPTTERHLLAPRRSPLTTLPLWTSVSVGLTAIATTVAQLNERIGGSEDPTELAVFVESITEFEDSDVERELEDLMRASMRGGSLFAAEADSTLWTRSSTFGRPMRTARRGIILQPEGDDEDLLNASFGTVRRGSLPPGRGFLVSGTKVRKLHVALPPELGEGGG